MKGEADFTPRVNASGSGERSVRENRGCGFRGDPISTTPVEGTD